MNAAREHLKFTIGRSNDCDIVIADESVSRLHAELTVLEGRLFLTDCRSKHGTLRLRDKKFHQLRQDFISPGDVVQFGLVKKKVEDLLAIIQKKNPSFDRDSVSEPDPEPLPTASRFQGARLVRCSNCGVLKKQSERCEKCHH